MYVGTRTPINLLRSSYLCISVSIEISVFLDSCLLSFFLSPISIYTSSYAPTADIVASMHEAHELIVVEEAHGLTSAHVVSYFLPVHSHGFLRALTKFSYLSSAFPRVPQYGIRPTSRTWATRALL